MAALLRRFSAIGCVAALAFGVPAWSSQPTRAIAAARQPTSASAASQAVALAVAPEAAVETAGELVQYGDGVADGKKSMAGAGQMIRFTAATGSATLNGIELHGARYGYPQAPKEDFKVYILDEDRSEVLRTELIPYAKFERGESKWVALKFKEPVHVPKTFWVVVDFNAEATKGVYVSYDTSTGGEHSMVGLPGREANKPAFGGDWMIRAVLVK